MGVYKRDGVYWIDYYISGSRKRKKVSSSKRQAERILSKIKGDIIEGKYIDSPNGHCIKFHKLCDRYITDHCKINKKSWDKIDSIHIRKFKRFFGNPSIGSIRQSDVERYKTKRVNNSSVCSINCSKASSSLKNSLKGRRRFISSRMP